MLIILEHIKRFLKNRFSLAQDMADESEIKASIIKGVEFKGLNVWVLIFAIFLASIGLNVNSIAVIIGAMLISPLMGPLLGMGLGVGIFDFDLIKSSAKNLSVMVLISLIASAFYFLISPLNIAQSELLSRTSPTIWDVLIAFFGGLAGIVGSSAKEKGNVLAGAAIATALMPPLCTAGFGLARGDIYFFSGALYLFFINTVFISVSAFIGVRLLKFKKANYVDKKLEFKVRRVISTIVILSIVPSLFIAYLTVKKALFEQRVQNFIHNEIQFPNTQLISKKVQFEKNKATLILIGEKLTEDELNILHRDLEKYKLKDMDLEIRQGLGSSDLDVNSLRANILEDVDNQNKSLTKEKDSTIRILINKIERYKSMQFPSELIAREAKALDKNIERFSIQKTIYTDLNNNNNQDTLLTVYCKFKKKPRSEDAKKLINWLKVRTHSDTLKFISE